MTTFNNPSLRQESRDQPVQVIPPVAQESLLSWLESNGRFLSSEIDFHDHKMSLELDEILESDIDELQEEDQSDL